MDERDIVERAKAWLIGDYSAAAGEVVTDLLSEAYKLRQSLSTTQAELAAGREDFALLKVGKDANETYLLAELAEARAAWVTSQAETVLARHALLALRARVVEVGRPFTERWRNHKSGYIASIPMVPVLREDVQAMADLIEEVSKVAP